MERNVNNAQRTSISSQSSASSTSLDGKRDAERSLALVLLPGEKIQESAEDIIYMDPFSEPVRGHLYVTNYRLYFHSVNIKPVNNKRFSTFYPGDSPAVVIVNLPLGLISDLIRRQQGGAASSNSNAAGGGGGGAGSGVSGSGGSSHGIEIHCKDFRYLRFACGHARRSIFDRLQEVAFPFNTGRSLFAFFYAKEAPPYKDNGWLVYNAREEYRRLGVPNDSWRLSNANDTYVLSQSYPRLIAVPAKVTDDDLRLVARFRTKGRIPVLSWIHSESQATICRSSQPQVTEANSRSQHDEEYIRHIREANAQSHELYIFDARKSSRANVESYKAKGGGTENPSYYDNMRYVFLDIDNVHAMRESFRKLQEMCFPRPEDSLWWSSLEQTGWLKHQKNILQGAVKIANKVENHRTSVLVHCADGWDRTSQLTSLAMLMLDPYYRTLRGFQVLVEKEWCSFGHRFPQRSGLGDNKHNSVERSPIFLQFVDAVWQMTQQFPHAFEFNEHFLTTVLDHLYSCRFGTFLASSEAMRHSDHMPERTVSLWSFVNAAGADFLNPFYYQSEFNHRVLFPAASYSHLRLWTGYYLRWVPHMRTQDPVRRRERELLLIVERLRERVADRRRGDGKIKTSTAHLRLSQPLPLAGSPSRAEAVEPSAPSGPPKTVSSSLVVIPGQPGPGAGAGGDGGGQSAAGISPTGNSKTKSSVV